MSQRETASAANGLHVIPVPRGWSVEQAWEAISRGDLLTDADPAWGIARVVNGRYVGLIEPGDDDATARPWLAMPHGDATHDAP